MSGKFEIYRDTAGEWRFRLKAPNGEIIAQGEGYQRRQGCERGIEAVKEHAPGAEVVEVEE